ncbi:MAG TPA: TIGR04086 family membrane protein [Firmicutes bacterium]|nr:TIGR04086 family membrane protein [Candidatus Fermentithermobacillaceae bacterium]
MPDPDPRSRTWTLRRHMRQEGFSLKTVFLGALSALGLGLLLALGSAVAIQLSSLDERIPEYLVDVGSFLVLGVTAFFVGRRVRNHGLAYGASIGAVYCLAGTLLGLAFPSGSFHIAGFLVRFVLLVLTGAVGSILGVNV